MHTTAGRFILRSAALLCVVACSQKSSSTDDLFKVRDGEVHGVHAVLASAMSSGWN